MATTKVREFSKRGDGLTIPDLTKTQADAYERFLQLGKAPDGRETKFGLEALLREVFPIESYDGTMKLQYLGYELGAPRFTTEVGWNRRIRSALVE